MFCSNCGNELAEGAKFCSVCGTRVTEAEHPVHEHIEEGSSNKGLGVEYNTERPAEKPFDYGMKWDSDESDIKAEHAKKASAVSFDWSSVVDEHRTKPRGNVKSPWDTTGLDDEEVEQIQSAIKSTTEGDGYRPAPVKEEKKAEEPKTFFEAPKFEAPIEPMIKDEDTETLEDRLFGNPEETPQAAGRSRTLNFIEMMKQEREAMAEEPKAPVVELPEDSDDFDYTETILPEDERENTQGYTDLKSDIIAELEKAEAVSATTEALADAPEESKDSAADEFEAQLAYIRARRQAATEAKKPEEPQSFIDMLKEETAEEPAEEAAPVVAEAKAEEPEEAPAEPKKDATLNRELTAILGLAKDGKIVEEPKPAKSEINSFGKEDIDSFLSLFEEPELAETEPEAESAMPEEVAAPALDATAELTPAEEAATSLEEELFSIGFDVDDLADTDDEEDAELAAEEAEAEAEEAAEEEDLFGLFSVKEDKDEEAEVEVTTDDDDADIEIAIDDEADEEDAEEEVAEEAEEEEKSSDDYDYLNDYSPRRRMNRTQVFAEHYLDDEEDDDEDEEDLTEEEDELTTAPDFEEEMDNWDEDDAEEEAEAEEAAEAEADSDEEDIFDLKDLGEAAVAAGAVAGVAAATEAAEAAAADEEASVIAEPGQTVDEVDNEIEALQKRLSQLLGHNDEEPVEVPKRDTLTVEDLVAEEPAVGAETQIEEEFDAPEADDHFDLSEYGIEEPEAAVTEDVAEEVAEAPAQDAFTFDADDEVPTIESILGEADPELTADIDAEIEAELDNFEMELDKLQLDDVELEAAGLEGLADLDDIEITDEASAEAPVEAPAVDSVPDVDNLDSELAALGFDMFDTTAEPDEADMLFTAESTDVTEDMSAEEQNLVELGDLTGEEDAMSIDDLEKDLFGEDFDGESLEATRKIEKFYTLYRKNEEFQRLLDEEYEKLQAGSADYTLMEGVLAEYGDEPKSVVEAAEAEAAAAAEAEAEAKAEPEVDETVEQVTPEVKAEAKKFTDKTIPEMVPVTLTDEPAPEVAPIEAKASKTSGIIAPELVDDEEEETKGGILTVIAVIVAVLLVLLLVVILILNFAPDSGIAKAISDMIGNFTNFAALDGSTDLLL